MLRRLTDLSCEPRADLRQVRGVRRAMEGAVQRPKDGGLLGTALGSFRRQQELEEGRQDT